jgi:predicted acetyltransferase
MITMTIRTLQDQELSMAKEIWHTCFDDQPAFVDWYFANRIKPHEVMGYFPAKGDRSLLADLHMAPYQLRLRNKLFPCAYLIALATRPEYRGRGIAKELLRHTLTHLAERGVCFSILLPFDLGFYTRLGWGVISRHQTIQVKKFPAQNTPERPLASPAPASSGQTLPGGKRIKSFAKTYPEEIQQLQMIYEKWTERFDGNLLREPHDWAGLLFDHYLDGGEVVFSKTRIDGQTKPGGYALVLPTEKKTTIREIAYNSLEAGEELWERLSKTGSSGLLWTAPISDPLVNLVIGKAPAEEFGEPTITRAPYMLGRITDLAGFVQQVPHPNLAINLHLEVHDPLLPQNCGVFQLYPADNGMFGIAPSSEPPEIRCGISLLTELLAGETLLLNESGDSARPHAGTPTYARGLWVREKKYLSILRKVFPQTMNYLNDYF